MLAMHGRHGEAPLPVVAARSPSRTASSLAIEAVRHGRGAPHPGDNAVRRIPGQRVRAVETSPKSQDPARHLNFAFATEPNRA